MVIKALNVERPLFFLCGPGMNGNINIDTDRRNIMLKEISEYKDRFDITPLPIIVDELFNEDDEIVDNQLNMKLLEEIVSNISCMTYIFLDTMSTSFELGLFTNSKQNNNVCLLLDSQYKDRYNCYVGEYITKSSRDSMVVYDARYDARGYVYFKNDTVPQIIKNHLEEIIKQNNSTRFTDVFFKRGMSNKHKFGRINYEVDVTNEKRIEFQVDIKTLFYLLSNYFFEKSIEFKKEMVNDVYHWVLHNIVETFIALSSDNEIRTNLLFEEGWKYSLVSYDYDMLEVLKNMCYIICVMKNKRTSYNNQMIKTPFVRNVSTIKVDNKIDMFDFFGLSKYKNKFLDFAKDYVSNPDYYTKTFDMVIKGKYRKIITYADNAAGRKLKEMHNIINNSLNKYIPSSEFSYAYKCGKNTHMCVNNHRESSVFYKYDIHSFFETMKKTHLIDKLKKLIEDKISSFYKEINYSKTKISWIFKRDDLILDSIVSILMINYKFPIGYVTSPKISDFYLYDFDNEVKNQLDSNYIYTRYSDDILISGNSCNSNINKTIQNCILKEGLVLNNKKTKIIRLKQYGDTVKFLGLVIKKELNNNSIKVSNSYISHVMKEIYDFEKKPNKSKLEKIRGTLNYIKYVDRSAFTSIFKIYSKVRGGNLNALLYE